MKKYKVAEFHPRPLRLGDHSIARLKIWSEGILKNAYSYSLRTRTQKTALIDILYLNHFQSVLFYED